MSTSNELCTHDDQITIASCSTSEFNLNGNWASENAVVRLGICRERAYNIDMLRSLKMSTSCPVISGSEAEP